MAVVNTNVIAIVMPAIAREGITKLVLSQIKTLQDKQYDVVLIVLSSITQEVFEEMNVYVASDRLLVLKQKDAYLSATNLLSSYLLLGAISKFLKRHHVKVVIAHAPYAHFVMRLVKLRLQVSDYNIKLIQYFHITQYAQFPLNTIRRLAINEMNKVLGKHCDDVHVFVSKAVKVDIELGLFNHPLSYVIYNALPRLNNIAEAPEDFKSLYKITPVKQRAFLLVVPGRIEQGKGQLFFVQTLNIFLKQMSLSPDDIQVLIIGEGVQKKELKNKIDMYCLNKFVSLLGVVPNAELLQWMNKADLVVLPSFFEGLPLVALEAIQVRTLLLTSDIASFQEVIQHGQNGFLFKAGDTVDCLAKLEFIYNNRNAKLIDLDKVAQQVVYRFSFEQHMAQLIQAINYSGLK